MRRRSRFEIKLLTVLLITIICYPLVMRAWCETQSNLMDSLEELSIIQDGDFWVIYLKEPHQELVRLAPEVWQGNANIFHTEGFIRVGHFWSQFLMLSPGKWLTDRVESEGEHLTYFNVLINEGKIIWYIGTWGFRDYFNTTAEHFVWVHQNYTFHLVNVDMIVLNDIQDVGAVWVELMNDRDVYSQVVSKTHDGIIQRNIVGSSGEHFLDEYTLDEECWISLQDPLKGQLGSPALIMLDSSHFVRPRWYDGIGIDNIELHLLNPRQTRTLHKGDKFRLQYLLVTGPVSIGHEWIDPTIEEARPVIELIKSRAIKTTSNISCFVNPATVEINQSIRTFGSIKPPIQEAVLTLTYTKPDSSTLTRTVTSGADGSYNYTYKPDDTGSWSVRASWKGDAQYEGAISSDVYFTVIKTSTTISITLSSSEVTKGGSITVSGSIRPAVSGAELSITFTKPDGSTFLRTTTTGSDGSYSDYYSPTETGSWNVKASWEGNTVHEGSTSQTLEFSVVEAPPPGSLKIIVKDENGNLISGATVSSTSQPSGQQTLGGSSGTDGSVLFSDVKSGSYTFQASKNGYVTKSVSVSAKAGETTELTITIEKEAPPAEEKKGCIIATTTYGSELSPEVQFLRGFRDKTVLNTFAGKNFMTVFNAWYYSFSPTIASAIAVNNALRWFMKILLYPLIGILHIASTTYSILILDPELAVVLSGLVASSLIGITYFAPIALIFCLVEKVKIPTMALRAQSLIWVISIGCLTIAEIVQWSGLMMFSTAMFVLATASLTTLASMKYLTERILDYL